MKDFVVMDAETKYLSDQVKGGWKNVYGMGLSSAVTYCSKEKAYRFWTDRKELCEYLNDKLVVTFNGIMFDSKLLLGDDRTVELNGMTRNLEYKWYNADIFIEIFRHIFAMDRKNYPDICRKTRQKKFPKGVFSLDGIAWATLGIKKFGNGAHAPELYQQDKIVELFQYNLQDVRVTLQLFEFIKEKRYIVTGGYDIVSFR
jgi:hypothetical protein